MSPALSFLLGFLTYLFLWLLVVGVLYTTHRTGKPGLLDRQKKKRNNVDICYYHDAVGVYIKGYADNLPKVTSVIGIILFLQQSLPWKGRRALKSCCER